MIIEKLTLGRLREATEKMADSTIINFMYRENLYDDDGKDYLFHPNAIWTSTEEDENPFVTLVSTIPPAEAIEDDDEEDCNDPHCDCHKATIQ